MKKNLPTIFFIALIYTFGFNAFGQTEKKPDQEFNIYGFGRANFIWDSHDIGQSDLFLPANIDVSSALPPSFFIGAKQTRFGIDYIRPVNGNNFEIKLEGDFHNNSSNGTGVFRMRHAYAKYKFVLVGMTWSNFFEIDANPNTVDFEGPNSSTLSRTPQIRFSTYKSKNELSLSLENPTNDYMGNDSITVLAGRLPDMIGSYRINGSLGFIKVAALLRELHYESNEVRTLIGYGANVAGKLNVGKKDNFKFQAIMGTGIAQYIEGAKGLGYDAFYNNTPELDPLQLGGGYVSYQHYWNENLHSSLTGGLLTVLDDPGLVATDFYSGYYGSANIFWEVIKDFSFGWEVLYGERMNVNDDTGSVVRVQMSATYKFKKTVK